MRHAWHRALALALALALASPLGLAAPAPRRPPLQLAYLKTHKTGSSTIATVLRRLGINRGLAVTSAYGANQPVLRAGQARPVRGVYRVGVYQARRPGQQPIETNFGAPWDVWREHVLFPDGLASARTAVPGAPYVLTSVREPRARFRSGFRFYSLGRCPRDRAAMSQRGTRRVCYGNTTHPMDSPDDICRTVKPEGLEAFACARQAAITVESLNTMAHEIAGLKGGAHAKAHCEAKDPARRRVTPSPVFLERLADIRRTDWEASEWRILLMERMDESLALLSLDEGLEPDEVAYMSQNIAGKKEDDARDDDAAELLDQCWKKLLVLDHMLYAAAMEQFERRIAAAGAERVARRAEEVRQATAKWARTCGMLDGTSNATGLEADPASSVLFQCWLMKVDTMNFYRVMYMLIGHGVALARDKIARALLPSIARCPFETMKRCVMQSLKSAWR